MRYRGIVAPTLSLKEPPHHQTKTGTALPLHSDIKQSHGSVSLSQGEKIPYTLYRMPSRKRVHLVIGEEGSLQVRAPRRFTRAQAESAIRNQAAWILDTLQRTKASLAQRPRLQTGTRFPFLDEGLVLSVIQAPRPSVIREGSTLRIALPTITEQGIRASLESWYRKQAQSHLTTRLAELAMQVGAYPARVSIRAQKTRWGSCSGNGNISLNWRLMLLPSQLVDYVLIHELCHLRHMNHSPAFWELVGRSIPNWKACRARLAELRGKLPL
uniref:YgjP-like metallopeptidase domain-containing protein n=1 Tax=Candidatus Kentrum sp. MB TaxID=2138164 RepID=A0A450XJ62_9GAMM|nr:MAG: hypothetical protein BECKMB1821G_GA0114241_103217 [Candidatus Kentron sp. MB]VFK29342.1 MAG: hypothetical protein BECKMB1821I_GA0114274_100941 [Candidatus Kentron sp. MB]VFK74756.1 MAG: hypothetical protein BECKMB1821H_GA0114242_100941 [Candidatus Kentron sp. MB]